MTKDGQQEARGQEEGRHQWDCDSRIHNQLAQANPRSVSLNLLIFLFLPHKTDQTGHLKLKKKTKKNDDPNWFYVFIFSGFKRRAPRAIREIKKFAEKQMGTADVRVDTRLNKQIWSKGVK